MFRAENKNQDFKQKGIEQRELDTYNVKSEGHYNLLTPNSFHISVTKGQEHDVMFTPFSP